MKKLTKYILDELKGPFLVGLSFFTVVFILSPILQLVDLLIVKRAPIGDVLLLFFYLLPCTIAIVLPMATLVAILMAYGRLSSDSEVIAMRASGISYLKIFIPAIIFSIIVSIAGIYFNDTLLPKGNFAFVKLCKEIAQRKPLNELDEHIVTPFSRNSDIMVEKINKKTDTIESIIIHQEMEKQGSIRTIVAKTGKWLQNQEVPISDTKYLIVRRLLLKDGQVQEPGQESIDDLSMIKYKKLIINNIEEVDLSTTIYKNAREKTTSEILAEIRQKEKRRKSREHRLWIEYHKRFSIPFAALAFVLIGLPFSIVSGRSGKSVSLGISIVIIVVYYIFYAYGESIGKSGELPEIVALWIPNILFFILGGYYIFRISKK